MTTVVVNLDVTQYVKVNSGLTFMVLQAPRDSVRIVFSDLKPAMSNTAFHMIDGSSDPLSIPYTFTDVWALATTDRSSLTVTELRDPLQNQVTAYDELITSNLIPEIQISPQYNNLDKVRVFNILGGTAGAEGGEYFASSGVSPNGIGAVFSERQLISRPGQGSLFRFGARFPDTGILGELRVGPSTAIDSVSFGYQSGVFAIGYEHGGAVIIEELTVTAATSAEDASIEINGTVYTVPLTSGTVQDTAHEIATSLSSQAPLFNFTQNDDMVVCRSILSEPESGSFSFSSATATGVWETLNNGLVPTMEYVEQADWNIDKKSNLVPSLTNQYQIQFDGDIKYFIKDCRTSSYMLVHVFNLSNKRAEEMFSIAAFRMACVVNNRGDVVDNRVHMGNAAAFNEGARVVLEPSRADINTQVSVGIAQRNIISIRCSEVYGDKVNLGRIRILEVTATNESNKTAILNVCKGVVFQDNADFRYINKGASIAETCKTDSIVADGECLVSVSVAPGASLLVNMVSLGDLLLPGEVVTMSMGVVSGGSTGDMTVAPVWKEDK